MDLAELIRSRRSISDYTDQPVPDGLVEELLETAIWVPNHHMTQPWRFVYVTGEGKRRYAEIRRDMALEGSKNSDPEALRVLGEQTFNKFFNVPAYLLVLMKESDDAFEREEDYASCACIVQNFILLAWERGVATAWKVPKTEPRLSDYYELQDREHLVAIVQIGYAKSIPASAKPRIPPQERISYKTS